MNKSKISEDISIIVVDGKSVKIRNPYFSASSHEEGMPFSSPFSHFLAQSRN